MSETLHWRPLRGREKEALPVALKTILVERFKIQPREPYLFDQTFLPYLQGLFDANVDGARALIDAIDQNEKVELLIF